MRRPLALVVSVALLASASGCIKRLAIRGVAGSLTKTADLFAADDDPELVREAVPFALKAIEGLLAEVPEHSGLLLTACQGFTQYAYAFVETDAMMTEPTDYRQAMALYERALRLYVRARDYGLRNLEVKRAGITQQLQIDPKAAVLSFEEPDVPALYWLGAAWGAAISLGRDRPELIADLPAVDALMRRALELDEAYGGGAIHEALISLESLPANMGGSIDRAREHFDRAVALSAGRRVGPYVLLAANVSVSTQDRREFEHLLQKALAIDPDAKPGWRLENLIGQKRARSLLDRADDLFLEPLPPAEGSAP